MKLIVLVSLESADGMAHGRKKARDQPGQLGISIKSGSGAQPVRAREPLQTLANGMSTDWDEPRGAVLKPIAQLLARNATKWIAQARGQAMAGSFAEGSWRLTFL